MWIRMNARRVQNPTMSSVHQPNRSCRGACCKNYKYCQRTTSKNKLRILIIIWIIIEISTLNFMFLTRKLQEVLNIYLVRFFYNGERKKK